MTAGGNRKVLLIIGLPVYIDEPLTVSRLAEEVGLSRYYFSTLFHQVSGETPQHYLAAARLKFATQLLQTNAYSIKEVAAHSGYADSSYFCRAFRKAYGVSPEAYRKRR